MFRSNQYSIIGLLTFEGKLHFVSQEIFLPEAFRLQFG